MNVESLVNLDIGDLMGRLEDCEDWPDPDVVEAIRDLGLEAVGPLRELVRRCADEPDEDDVADIAAGLLGDLRATEAVPDLLLLLRHGEEDDVHALENVLRRIGGVPLGDVAAIILDEGIEGYRRAVAVELYVDLAHGNQEALDSLAELCRRALETIIARVDSIDDEDRGLAVTLVQSLVALKYSPGRSAVEASIDAGVVDKFWIDLPESDLELRSPRRPAPELSFVEEYRRDWKAAHSPPDLESLDELHESPLSGDEFMVPHVSAPVRIQKPGRNDACPCGSGRKFKKCCLSKAQPDPHILASDQLRQSLAWNVTVEMPPVTSPRPNTVEVHPQVPRDLRRRLERVRLESLALFRCLDDLGFTPADLTSRLRDLMELDADLAEALWGLDQPIGTFSVKAMIRDTMESLNRVPQARAVFLGELAPESVEDIQHAMNDSGSQVWPHEAYNLVKGRDPRAK